MTSAIAAGLRVQLVKGWKPQVVIEVITGPPGPNQGYLKGHRTYKKDPEEPYVRTVYEGQLAAYGGIERARETSSRRWRPWSQFQVLSNQHYLTTEVEEIDETPEQESNMTTDVLFQTKEPKPRYGIKRGNSGDGKIILEMKGAGEGFEGFDPEQIEEVLPYTVGIEQLNGRGGGHLVCRKGQLEKDQVLLELHTGDLYRVTQLDSKCRTPKNSKSNWLLIPTQKITLGSSADDEPLIEE